MRQIENVLVHVGKTMNFQDIKVGHLVIVKRSGIAGRETDPLPVVGLSATEIILPHMQSFYRSNGEQVQEPRVTKNDAGEPVEQKPDLYPAKILRIATPSDLAKAHAKQVQAEAREKAGYVRNTRMGEIADWFPPKMRPHVEAARFGGGLRLEFDGLSESIVRSMADFLSKVAKQ